MPTIGVRHGREQVREWLELFAEHFQPVRFEIHRTFEGGDQAVITGHLVHRILGTGREFESDFANHLLRAR